MIVPPLIFETERLLVKPTTIAEAPFMLQLLNSEGWLKNIGDRKVYTEEDATAYIETKLRPQIERLGYGNFTVFHKQSKLPIGTCGLYDRDGLEGIDIGFAFLPEYFGKGYGYESAQKLFEIATGILVIKPINAITTKENKASQKLLEKLGFMFIKTITLPNDNEELLFYSTQN